MLCMMGIRDENARYTTTSLHYNNEEEKTSRESLPCPCTDSRFQTFFYKSFRLR